MIVPDVVDLAEFYRTPLGGMARRIVAHRIRARWRDTRGMTVAGLGYATPYLSGFLNEASRVIAFMPQAQGAMVWPQEGPSRTVLVDEMRLPVPDLSINRLLVVHCLEHTEASSALLREVWRVLAPEGRLLIVAANRHGLWSSREATPFGQGMPFSRSQIEVLLKRSMFAVDSISPALFMPPVNWTLFLHSATAWERTGAYFWPLFSGLLVVEAVKQIYAVLPRFKGKRAKVKLAGQTVSVHGINDALQPRFVHHQAIAIGDLLPPPV
jgi:SAM-dependent methyltransferase